MKEKRRGRMQRPPSMRDSIFLPLQNRTVSHQRLCLPLISQLRDLAPDKPRSASKDSRREKPKEIQFEKRV